MENILDEEDPIAAVMSRLIARDREYEDRQWEMMIDRINLRNKLEGRQQK